MVKHEKIGPNKFQKFLMLLIVGFFIVFVGIILVFAAFLFGEGSLNFGAIIFIGPFPIVVGAGPEAPLMVLFAITIAVLSIIMFLIIRREIKKAKT